MAAPGLLTYDGKLKGWNIYIYTSIRNSWENMPGDVIQVDYED